MKDFIKESIALFGKIIDVTVSYPKKVRFTRFR